MVQESADEEGPDKPDIKTLQEQRMKEILDHSHAALLVIDLQNDFLAPEGKSAKWGHNIEPMLAILPRVEEVTNLFYRLGRPVIRTKTYEDPEFRTDAGKDRFLFFEEGDKEKGIACLRGTEGAELFVQARAKDIVVEKTRVSAYMGTNLRDHLQKNGIKTIFVVGVKTQRCVARTVQDLYENEPNLHVVVLEDCVASDDIAKHEAALAEFKEFYPPVISSGELIKKWSKMPSATRK